MGPKPPFKGGPRKSNAGTPVPSEPEGPYVPTLADRLSYADAPRPFKSAHFVSRLPSRTATTSTSIVKKNAKQILTLERERLSGGDGFLSAAQTAAKARGEVIDVTKKKKGSGTAIGGKKGNIQNLLKGRMKRESAGGGSGVATPLADSVLPSGATTPLGEEEEEDEPMDVDGANTATNLNGSTSVNGSPVKGEATDTGLPRKEIITYHTPTAPPSLLPAKKYCDITGLHAAYTDPRTKLRYKGLDVWHVVRGLGPGGDQAYLALRGAQTALK